MWLEGASLSVVAAALGTSRNAVAGKVHRLKLASRPSPIIRGVGKPKPPVPEPPAPVPEPVVTPPTVVRVARRGGARCQWPFGDPGRPGFRFCGGPVAVGRPYCPEHVALAYVPTRTPRAA